VHFHVGQFPTIELHALARDRQWFDIALNSVVPHLAKTQPLQSAAWNDWKSRPKRDFSGSWRIAGHLPVDGAYDGRLTITRTGADRYEVALHATHANGKVLEGRGSAVVYTGYEWRAELKVDGVPLRQVLAASPDGRRLSGRMFQAQHDEIGGELRAVRSDAGVQVLAVSPSYLKAGETTELTIVGAGLKGAVSLGGGVRVKTVSQSPERIVVRATADARARPGVRSVQVGQVKSDQAFAVYDRVARVEVEPPQSIARIGENGASQAKVRATYRAVAYAAGQDGKPGTEDDIRLGYMPATWSVKPFDELAEHDKDVEFAGTMDAANGIFTPGDAGPNPQRLMSANNVGNLSVVATVRDGGQQVDGEGHLLVTIQNYMNPRIR
jgi:quinohemoprotein amine dehydrogenase